MESMIQMLNTKARWFYNAALTRPKGYAANRDHQIKIMKMLMVNFKRQIVNPMEAALTLWEHARSWEVGNA
jgi:hypothetical protein